MGNRSMPFYATRPEGELRYQENRPARPVSSAGEGGMKRQRSVRFVGSKAEGQRPLGPKVTHTNIHTLQKKPSTGSLRPRPVGGALTNDVAVPATYRPPSRNSSFGQVPDCSPGHTQNYAAALAGYDEHHIREDDLASTPSSYRKIRRSKSMLHTNGTGVAFYTGTPESERPTTAGSRWGGVRSSAPQGPRAMKSMSFLQPSKLRNSTGPDGYDVDVQIARDQFFRQVEQQRLNSQPSFMRLGKKSKSDGNKDMRKSMRRLSSETNSYGMPIASTGAVLVTAQQNASMRSKARKASKSLKNRIKSLFKRSSTEEETLPPQEVQSTRHHMNDYQVQIGPPSSIHDEFMDVVHPADDPNLSRVAAGYPSLHHVASQQQLRSLAGSMQSMRSEASTQSRLTSWGTTATNTTEQQTRWTAAEREKHRLSIINENGTHKASSSFSRPLLKNQFSPYPSFHYPGGGGNPALSPVQSLASPSPQGQITSPVDSARVYSALMKRLDETSPQAKLRERASKASLASHRSLTVPPTPVPPKRSSIEATPQETPQITPATIRSVPRESEPPLPIRQSPSQMDLSEFGPPPPGVGNQDGSVGYKSYQYMNRSRATSETSRTSTVITKTRIEKQQVDYRAFPPPVMGGVPTRVNLTPQQVLSITPGMTPQMIANQLEKHSSSSGRDKGLRETKSTFFGSRDVQIIGRVASPYRRAVAEAEFRDSLILLSSEEFTGSADSSPMFSPELRVSKQWPIRQSMMQVDSEVTGSVEERVIEITSSRESSPGMSTPKKTKVKETPNSKESAETGSLYSRTTSGETPPISSIEEVEDEEVQEPEPRDSPWESGKHGSMVLLEHSTYRTSDRSEEKSKRNTTSSEASIDWKAWMKGEVESLSFKGRQSMEKTREVFHGVVPKKSMSIISRASQSTIRPSAAAVSHSTSESRPSLERTKSGHRREMAQIHGDETSVGPGAASGAVLSRARRGFYHKPQAQPMGEAQTQLLAQQRAGLSHIPKPVLKSKASVGSFNLDLHSFPPPPNQLPPPPSSSAPLPLYFGKEERSGSHRRGSSVAGSAAKKSLSVERPALQTRNTSKIDATVTPHNTPQPLSERVVSSSTLNARHSRSASAQVPVSGSGGIKKGLRNKNSAQTIRPVDWEFEPGFPVPVQGLPPSINNVGSGGTSGRDTPNKLTKKSENVGRRISYAGSRTYTPSPGMGGGISKMVSETWGSAGRRMEAAAVAAADGNGIGYRDVIKPAEFDGLSPMIGPGVRGNENWLPGRGERYGDGSVGCQKLDAKAEVEPKQATGSRRMVDIFLNSRRRAMKGSEDSNAAAFI